MVEIKIVVHDDGKVNVNGPIANKLLCYGMLEMARDAIKNFSEQSSSGIVGVSPGLVLPIKNGQ